MRQLSVYFPFLFVLASCQPTPESQTIELSSVTAGEDPGYQGQSSYSYSYSSSSSSSSSSASKSAASSVESTLAETRDVPTVEESTVVEWYSSPVAPATGKPTEALAMRNIGFHGRPDANYKAYKVLENMTGSNTRQDGSDGSVGEYGLGDSYSYYYKLLSRNYAQLSNSGKELQQENGNRMATPAVEPAGTTHLTNQHNNQAASRMVSSQFSGNSGWYSSGSSSSNGERGLEDQRRGMGWSSSSSNSGGAGRDMDWSRETSSGGNAAQQGAVFWSSNTATANTDNYKKPRDEWYTVNDQAYNSESQGSQARYKYAIPTEPPLQYHENMVISSSSSNSVSRSSDSAASVSSAVGNNGWTSGSYMDTSRSRSSSSSSSGGGGGGVGDTINGYSAHRTDSSWYTPTSTQPRLHQQTVSSTYSSSYTPRVSSSYSSYTPRGSTSYSSSYTPRVQPAVVFVRSQQPRQSVVSKAVVSQYGTTLMAASYYPGSAQPFPTYYSASAQPSAGYYTGSAQPARTSGTPFSSYRTEIIKGQMGGPGLSDSKPTELGIPGEVGSEDQNTGSGTVVIPDESFTRSYTPAEGTNCQTVCRYKPNGSYFCQKVCGQFKPACKLSNPQVDPSVGLASKTVNCRSKPPPPSPVYVKYDTAQWEN